MLPLQSVVKAIPFNNTSENQSVALLPFSLVPSSPKTQELLARHHDANDAQVAQKTDKTAVPR